MEWVETTAKSVAAAKEAALDQLGVDESDAEFEVLEEPRPGLFGRLRGEARVRARVRPTRPRPKVERRNRTRTGSGEPARSGRSRRPSEGQPAPTSGESRPPGVGSDGQRRRKRRRRGRSASRPVASTDPSKAPAGSEADAAAAPAAGRTRTSPSRAESSPPPTSPPPTSPPPTSEAQKGTSTMTDATVEQQAAIVQEFLEGLVDAFAVEASVSQVRIDDETIEVRVAGEDLGLLIGPKGQTLQAVQDLARTAVQRQAAGTHYGRVRIDVGGYRQRRREALERFARQVAEDVRAKGVQKALEPMNAADRKVVHDVVNEIEGVSTISEGEEPRRRVVILPASS